VDLTAGLVILCLLSLSGYNTSCSHNITCTIIGSGFVIRVLSGWGMGMDWQKICICTITSMERLLSSIRAQKSHYAKL